MLREFIHEWCLFISVDFVIRSSVYGVAAYPGEERAGGVFLFVLLLQLCCKQEEFDYQGSYCVTKQAGLELLPTTSCKILFVSDSVALIFRLICSLWLKLYMMAVKVQQLQNDCKALLLWTLLNQMRPILKFTERSSIIKLLQSLVGIH